MAQADIQVLVGVLGGGSISGKSGVMITNQLANIFGHINKGEKAKLRPAIDSNDLQGRVIQVVNQINGSNRLKLNFQPNTQELQTTLLATPFVLKIDMSLKVWLPLISDYKNYGLSDLEFVRNTNYRYIRFVINATRGSTDAYTQLSKLEFIDIDNNVYSYPSGAAVSTTLTGYPASEPPSSIIDGSVDTKFCTLFSSSGYVQIDLGAAERIDLSKYSRFRWYTANDGDWRDPISFEVRFSTDGTTFSEGIAVTNMQMVVPFPAVAVVAAAMALV